MGAVWTLMMLSPMMGQLMAYDCSYYEDGYRWQDDEG